MDGMPGYAFGFSDVMSYLGPFVLRTFDMGERQTAKDTELTTIIILELIRINP